MFVFHDQLFNYLRYLKIKIGGIKQKGENARSKKRKNRQIFKRNLPRPTCRGVGTVVPGGTAPIIIEGRPGPPNSFRKDLWPN